MTIGIDARLYGPKHTGIGRYTQNLIDQLLIIDSKNSYVLFGDPQLLSVYQSNPQVRIVKLTTRVYTIREQLVNGYVFSRQKLDLLHIPHFNAPLSYSGKLVITVHDLIKHYSVGSDTTTLPAWQYGIKHLAYKALVATNLKKAQAIITPTNYWKNELIEKYFLDPQKITVTYEGISPIPRATDIKNSDHFQLQKPYLIYTGNLYPHKNVDTLIKAVDYFNQTHDHQLQLAIIGARSQFSNRLPDKAFIRNLGYVPDADLPNLYGNALALVQPSFIEGFGLTGLEAMSLGLPVISSNATCLPEVYQDAALYFDPYSFVDLSAKIDQLISEHDLRTTLIDEGYKQVKLYSARKMAKQTLQVYEQVFRS